MRVRPGAFILATLLLSTPARCDRVHVLPSLSGTTGLVDVPVAFTAPHRGAIASAQLDRATAGERYWAPYGSVEQAHRYLAVTYGAWPNVEVGATLESWDKDIVYANPVGTERPEFLELGDLYPGLSAKVARALPKRFAKDVWVAAGFRFQLGDGARDVTEFHEYERFSQAYAVLSTEPAAGLFAHALVRRVILPDSPTVAGRTAGFVGYAVPGSWTQYGLAGEWYFTPRASVFGEVLEESRVRFRGDLDRTSVNAGIRYQDGEKGIGVWTRRANVEGFSDHGLQMAWRF